MVTQPAKPSPKSLTPSQSKLAVEVFGILRKRFGSQGAVADMIGVDQSLVSRAMKGETSLPTLTKAAQLAGIDPQRLEEVGIPVVRMAESGTLSRADLIRATATADGISADAINAWFRQRGAKGLHDVLVTEAVHQMERIMMKGRPIAAGNAAAVDELLDERPAKGKR